METSEESIEANIPRLCVCGREAQDPRRKLCWSCTMHKYRHGVTWPDLVEQRVTEKKVCEICSRLTRRDPITFKGHRVCSRCVKVLLELNRGNRDRFISILDEPVSD